MSRKAIIITFMSIIIVLITLFFLLNINKKSNDFVIINENEICPKQKEKVYEDDFFEYNISCAFSNKVFVKFINGEKINIKKALRDRLITVKDVLKANYIIYYIPKYKLMFTKTDKITEVKKADYNIYLYMAEIKYDEQALEKVLLSNKVSIDVFIDYFEFLSLTKSGNKTITNDNIKYSSLEYAIVKCNNGDYYIGYNYIDENTLCK